MALKGPLILKHLYDRYYTQNQYVVSETELVSSHWRHFSAESYVKLDDMGIPVMLTGVGFGDNTWNSLAKPILDKLCILSYLPQLPMKWRRERRLLHSTTRNICARMGLDLTYDVFRQECVLAVVKAEISDQMKARPLRILMIGDGYGVLSALTKETFPQAQLVLVDIGKVLFFQAYYCQKANPQLTHRYWEGGNEEASDDFIYCPAEFLQSLDRLKFDIAINVNSMQEMNPSVIGRYFTFMRQCLTKDNLFYCCNRECNTLCGGEVVEFGCYPWAPGDVVLLDKYCPWQRYFLAVNWPKNGPTLGPLKLPIVNYFAGKTRHRLVRMEVA